MSELLYTPYIHVQYHFSCGCSLLRIHWKPEPEQPRDVYVVKNCPQCAARAQRIAAAKKAKRGEGAAV